MFTSIIKYIYKHMTYRYIYKITCTQDVWNNHFYYGRHKTNNLDDGYKGSGTKLRLYFEKYPNDYIKEIVCYCESDKELCEKERYYINKYLRHPLCLNLIEFSSGGSKGPLSENTKKKISDSMKGHKLSEETRRKISEAVRKKNYIK